MIFIRMYGGLGNQMFQYSLGRSLSLKKESSLWLDVSWFRRVGNKENRPYCLNVFNIKCKEINACLLTGFFSLFKKIIIKEKEFYKFDENILKNNKRYFDGYWQNEKYFKDIREELIKDFTLKNGFSEFAEKMNQQILSSNSVSLHIRRGDYVQNQEANKFHGICSPEYYSQAMNLIEQKIENPHYFVFSDEVGWVRENIKFNYPVDFVSGNSISEAEELSLMSKCKHNIIANSSFSWWGTWLNTSPEKIVIAPKKWIENTDLADASDLIPKEWIKI